MKRNINIIIALFLSMLVFSCKKADFNYPEGYVGSSKITYFPEVTTKGSRLTIINQGSTYTDQGATATVKGAPGTYTTSGTVNTAVPGIYSITYSAKNEDGFFASDFRTVVVIGNDVPASRDFSGTYDRVGAAQTSTWTKIGTGVYKVKNPGGAVLADEVTAVNYTGNIIAVPLQLTSVGEFSAKNGTYNLTAVPPQYTWSIVNAGYGTQARTFIKR
jgi:hypothetical protein